MNLRTYRAYTLQQALDAVREDLGPGAVILRTATARRRGFMGLGSQTIVEVTASDGPPPASFRLPGPANDDRQPERRAPRESSGASASSESSQEHARRLQRALRRREEREAGGTPPKRARPDRGAEPTQEPASFTPTPTPPPTPPPPGDAAAEPPELDLETERRRTRELARRMLADHEQAAAAAATPAIDAEPPVVEPSPESGASPSSPPDRLTRSVAPPVPPPARPISVSPPREPDEPTPAPTPTPTPTVGSESGGASIGPRPPRADVARRLVLRPVDDDAPGAAPAETPRPAVPEVIDSAPGVASGGRVGRPPARARDEELEAIGGLVGEVLRDATERRRGPLPPGLFAHHLSLVGGEMSQDLAGIITDEVHAGLSEEQLRSPEVVAEAMHEAVAARIPVAEDPLPARSPDGRPLTIAFVGPTGVGKTTTVAKLAAALQLRHGRTVGLITSDTYRIAAVEQLRTYADIIGVPLQVAMDAAAMREATLTMADREVILIDTAGRSQRDEDRIGELRRFIDAAEPHDVHMVLSGIAGHRGLRREADAFRRVGVRKLVLTKLDEAVSFGMLVEAVSQIAIPLSFFTVGQEVPDDLERATADRLASLALESTEIVLTGHEAEEGDAP